MPPPGTRSVHFAILCICDGVRNISYTTTWLMYTAALAAAWPMVNGTSSVTDVTGVNEPLFSQCTKSTTATRLSLCAHVNVTWCHWCSVTLKLTNKGLDETKKTAVIWLDLTVIEMSVWSSAAYNSRWESELLSRSLNQKAIVRPSLQSRMLSRHGDEEFWFCIKETGLGRQKEKKCFVCFYIVF